MDKQGVEEEVESREKVGKGTESREGEGWWWKREESEAASEQSQELTGKSPKTTCAGDIHSER